MKKYMLLICLMILLVFTVSIAAANKIETVNVKGFGKTNQESLQDGLRNALMQVAGSYMSSTSIVKNFALIDDKILTYSNGFIEGYKVISTNHDKKIFVSTLEVKVKAEKLTTKIKQLNVARVSVDIDKKKIESSIQKNKFNANNLDEIKKIFSEVVVKPILEGKTHSVKFKKFNIYEILEIPKKKYPNLLFKVKNIKTDSENVIKINEKFIDSAAYRILTNKNKYHTTFENNYLIGINYHISLTDKYYHNIKGLLDVIADKKEKGVSLASYKNYKNKKFIVLSKLSHIADRDIFTNVYQFKEKKWRAIIKSVNNVKLEPSVKFSILDEENLPIKKWRHQYKPTSYSYMNKKCRSGLDFTIACGICKGMFEKINDYHKSYFIKFIRGGNQYQNLWPFIFGITKSSESNIFYLFNFSNKYNLKSLIFLKNSSIDLTSYILLSKKDTKLIKSVQISINPNPINK